MNNKKILITGGSGLIGKELIAKLTCNFSGFTGDCSEKSAFCSNRNK